MPSASFTIQKNLLAKIVIFQQTQPVSTPRVLLMFHNMVLVWFVSSFVIINIKNVFLICCNLHRIQRQQRPRKISVAIRQRRGAASCSPSSGGMNYNLKMNPKNINNLFSPFLTPNNMVFFPRKQKNFFDRNLCLTIKISCFKNVCRTSGRSLEQRSPSHHSLRPLRSNHYRNDDIKSRNFVPN